MLKGFKTEIYPTEEQKLRINKTIGTCRFIYNFYLAYNKELYDSDGKFMTGRDFSLWLNNVFLSKHPEKNWIKEDPSSKMCHNCGNIKKDLKLSDRTYHCNRCGYKADRDFNASLNLRDTKEYKIS